MATQLTREDFQHSLNDHVVVKAFEAREKYGPQIGWHELQRMLLDRAVTRYPVQIAFDPAHLAEGECAHPEAQGERPEDGFIMFVHPYFASRPDAVVPLVLYQLVLVNYGDFASPDDAEAFGAGVMGLSREDYYQLVCDLADEIGAP